MEKEIFKDIENFPGYMISNLGNIVSFKRDVFKPIKRIDRGGNIGVSLSRNNHGNTRSLAKLVAEHFLNNVNNHNYIKFKNGDYKDCRASNLEWCTQSSIEKDKYDKRREMFLKRSMEEN